MLEDSTRLVNMIGMFSGNESYDEISTSHLKFLLLPFFLAQTTLKLCVQDRKNVVEVAKVYYEDFLKRCEEYGLCERSTTAVSKATDIILRTNDEMQRLTQMAHQRNQKLQKYQQKKELKDQIKQLKVAMERDHTDEDVKRNFYLKLIKSCVWETQDELQTLDQEFEILEHIAKLREHDPEFNRKESPDATTSRKSQPKPLKPIIITKNELQKAIYGAGYPSLPTYTVQEFYDQRVAEGLFPSAEQSQKMGSSQGRLEVDQEAEQANEDAEKEAKVECDDPEYLLRARNMDEYKDDHRRGWGNRHNRS
jgi:immunoglobulin-binding protein 1